MEFCICKNVFTWQRDSSYSSSISFWSSSWSSSSIKSGLGPNGGSVTKDKGDFSSVEVEDNPVFELGFELLNWSKAASQNPRQRSELLNRFLQRKLYKYFLHENSNFFFRVTYCPHSQHKWKAHKYQFWHWNAIFLANHFDHHRRTLHRLPFRRWQFWQCQYYFLWSGVLREISKLIRILLGCWSDCRCLRIHRKWILDTHFDQHCNT